MRVWAVTWNMNGQSAPVDALVHTHAHGRYHVVAVGTEECERSIAQSMLNASKERWEQQLAAALGPRYARVASQTLGATHVVVFVHAALQRVVNDVRTAAVPCGMGDLFGNKGGVGIGFNIGKTAFLFLNAHLAAHQHAVAARNRDYWRIEKTMALVPAGHALEASMSAQQELERLRKLRVAGAAAPAESLVGVAGGRSTKPELAAHAPVQLPEDSDEDDEAGADTLPIAANSPSAANGALPVTPASGPAVPTDMHDDAAEAALDALFEGSSVPRCVSDRYDRVFFLGDFNYRISLSRERVEEALSACDWQV